MTFIFNAINRKNNVVSVNLISETNPGRQILHGTLGFTRAEWQKFKKSLERQEGFELQIREEK